MDKKLRSALGKVYAEDALIERTASMMIDEIRRRERHSKAVRFRLAAACVSLLLMFALGGFSLNVYLTPTAYIDMDVNPSIELTANRFGRVIGEHAYNEDGEHILNEVGVRNLSYSDALDRLIGAMKQDGYLEQDGLVSIAIQTEDGNLLQDVQASVNASLSGHHLTTETDVFAVTQDVKAIAGEHHLSPAKYLAITELQQVDPAATIEGCRDHSIGELRQLVREHSESHQSGIDGHDEGHEPESSSPVTKSTETVAPSPTPQSEHVSGNHTEKKNQHRNGHH